MELDKLRQQLLDLPTVRIFRSLLRVLRDGITKYGYQLKSFANDLSW